MAKWIAVDFDHTLATGSKFGGPLGKPIKPMLDRVKEWIKQRQEVRIFTARADSPTDRQRVAEWLDQHGIGGLAITNKKDGDMAELWDDRAIRVLADDGHACGECAKAARFRHTPAAINAARFQRTPAAIKTDC